MRVNYIKNMHDWWVKNNDLFHSLSSIFFLRKEREKKNGYFQDFLFAFLEKSREKNPIVKDSRK